MLFFLLYDFMSKVNQKDNKDRPVLSTRCDLKTIGDIEKLFPFFFPPNISEKDRKRSVIVRELVAIGLDVFDVPLLRQVKKSGFQIRELIKAGLEAKGINMSNVSVTIPSPPTEETQEEDERVKIIGIDYEINEENEF